MRDKAFAVLDLPGDAPRGAPAIEERMAEATSRVRLGDPGLWVDSLEATDRGMQLMVRVGLDQPPLYSMLQATNTLAVVESGRMWGLTRILLFRVAGCKPCLRHTTDKALDGVHFSECDLLGYNDLRIG